MIKTSLLSDLGLCCFCIMPTHSHVKHSSEGTYIAVCKNCAEGQWSGRVPRATDWWDYMLKRIENGKEERYYCDIRTALNETDHAYENNEDTQRIRLSECFKED